MKWNQHEDVVSVIRSSGDQLVLQIITPVDRNYLNPSTQPRPTNRGQRSNSQGQLLLGNVRDQKSATWNIRPSSASSTRRFSIGDGTLKKSSKNTLNGKSGSKMSLWTLRRNRSKSREKTLEAIAFASR